LACELPCLFFTALRQRLATRPDALHEFIMVSPVDDHRLNDDMLRHERDRKLAASKCPSLVHALDHQELRQLFIEYDAPASRAKRTGLMAGLGAIGLGFFALAANGHSFSVATPISQGAH
jgi:hypothetical protein